MIFITSSRLLTFSFIFTCLRGQGFIVSFILMAIPVILVICLYVKKLDPQYFQLAILGAAISMSAPCIVMDDFSSYYLIVGLSSTLTCIGAVIILVTLVKFDVIHPMDSEMIKLMQSDEMYMYVYLILVLVLLLISIGSIVFLHKFLDPVTRLRFSKWFTLGCCLNEKVWKPEEKLWIPYIEDLLEKGNFDAQNRNVEAVLGKSFLEFSALTGKYQFSKVFKNCTMHRYIVQLSIYDIGT